MGTMCGTACDKSLSNNAIINTVNPDTNSAVVKQSRRRNSNPSTDHHNRLVNENLLHSPGKTVIISPSSRISNTDSLSPTMRDFSFTTVTDTSRVDERERESEGGEGKKKIVMINPDGTVRTMPNLIRPDTTTPWHDHNSDMDIMEREMTQEIENLRTRDRDA